MSIASDVTRIESAKAAIKAAIEGKGVTVPDATLLDGMAALIAGIEADYGPFSKIIAGTYTPAEDTREFSLPGVFGYSEYVLAIANDGTSGTITSGHFRIGIDSYVTRVSRFYSSTLDGYSPTLSGSMITIMGASMQGGITYRYIFATYEGVTT